VSIVCLMCILFPHVFCSVLFSLSTSLILYDIGLCGYHIMKEGVYYSVQYYILNLLTYIIISSIYSGEGGRHRTPSTSGGAGRGSGASG